MIAYHDDMNAERGGVILRSGRIVEVRNISPRPGREYVPSLLNLKYVMSMILCRVYATWHTHPNTSSAPTRKDRKLFSWALENFDVPAMYIIGQRGDVTRLTVSGETRLLVPAARRGLLFLEKSPDALKDFHAIHLLSFLGYSASASTESADAKRSSSPTLPKIRGW